MRIPESELIINGDSSAFHIHIRPEQLADSVILVGDPGRVAMVKSYFASVEAEGASREFCWATGRYNGKRITVLDKKNTLISCNLAELDKALHKLFNYAHFCICLFIIIHFSFNSLEKAFKGETVKEVPVLHLFP